MEGEERTHLEAAVVLRGFAGRWFGDCFTVTRLVRTALSDVVLTPVWAATSTCG